VRGLEEMRTAHPLSVAAAVAALKRYIAEDRFRIRLDDLVREEAIRAARAAEEVLPRSTLPTEAAARALHPRRKTPASDHVFDLVGALAADLVPGAEALFDELEVWLGLAAAEGADPTLSIGLLIPPGRFMWKGFPGHPQEQPGQTFSEAEQAGASWAPLAAGWFGGDLVGFQKARAVFQARLDQLAPAFW
jgi:hypothetical protein